MPILSMILNLRLRIDRISGDHVHFSVFAGGLGGTRGNAGGLCLCRDEYEAFARLLGCEHDKIDKWLLAEAEADRG